MILNHVVIVTNIICGNMTASNLTSLSTLLPLALNSGEKTLSQLAFHLKRSVCIARRRAYSSNKVEEGSTATHSWTQASVPKQKHNETTERHGTREQELRPHYRRADFTFDFNSVSFGIVADHNGVVKKSYRRTGLITNPLPYPRCVLANKQLTGPQALYWVLAATIPTRTTGKAEKLLTVVFSHEYHIKVNNNIRELMEYDKHSFSISLTLDKFGQIAMSAKAMQHRKTFAEGKDYKFISDPAPAKTRNTQWTFYVGFLVDFIGKQITAIDVDEAKTFISFTDIETKRPFSVLLQMDSAKTVQIQPHSQLNITRHLGIYLEGLLARN